MPARNRNTGNPNGRPKGRKNKATIEREEIARRELAIREERMESTRPQILSRKLAKEVLDDLMILGVGLAAHYQPSVPGQSANANADEDRFWRSAEFARDCAIALARYESPTFKAIFTQPPPQQQVPTEATRPAPGVARIGDPMRVYQQMIRKVAAA